MKNIALFLFACMGVTTVFSQRDTVIVLQEVVLSDSKLQQFAEGYKITRLNDSVLERNSGLLTDNLKFTTPIYFKQNGYGMVSSPSFRGTTASQTAVVWNGININSQLNGQTDFNALMVQNSDDVVIRSGGGSTQYGTGAIGGSIHLNQELVFDRPLENKLQLAYGSFDTSRVFYNANWGTEKTSFAVGLSHFGSANDYKYLGTGQRNENGAFSNQNLNIAIGTRISSANVLKIYHNSFFGDRDFSGTLTAPSNSNYRTLDSRSLLEWANYKSRYVQRVKLAYIYERYRYYANKNVERFSFGQSGSVLANYDYLYKFKNWKLNGILEANTITAKGSSILKETRNRFAATVLINHKPTKQFSYGFNLRKDWVTDYVSPFVFALDAKYAPAENYSIHLNASKNFRVPTYNDLYWEGAGNPDLLPESALQAELGQTILVKNMYLSVTGFFIDATDLIQWRPDSSGRWSPINVKNVNQYGLEVETEITKKAGKHYWQWKNLYALTKAIDTDTRNQLTYVPFHKLTTNLAYSFKKWGSFAQALYNGLVYTTTDESASLPAYVVVNMGVERKINWSKKAVFTLGINVNNVLNKAYQNIAFRPMPNRNIQIQIITKF